MREPCLSDLVDLLAWDGKGKSIIQDWPAAYFEALMGRVADSAPDSESVRAVRDMSPARRQFFLGGPEIAWRALSNDGPGLSYWLTRYLLACLGDDAGLTGLHFGQDFVADFGSDYAFPDRGKDERLRAYSETEGLQIVDLVHAALDDVGEGVVLAKTFTIAFTNWIICRKEERQPRSFTSGSYDKHAGVTYLSNPLSFRDDPEKIFDAVLHEAIHAAIYMFEILEEPLCGEKREDVRIKSPWTGRQLTLDQYTQACFVWWGLYNFWTRRPACEDSKANERAAFYRARALAGLENDPVSALMANAAASERLSTAAGAALTAIRETCSRTGVLKSVAASC